MKQNSIASGISWKLIERFSVQIVRFVLQIVLARILDPEHYGSLALLLVFTTLANVFIQKGFSKCNSYKGRCYKCCNRVLLYK